MKAKKLLSFFALFLALGLVLTGCGGAADAAPSGEGRGDGVLVVGTPQPQAGLFNPLYAASVYDVWTSSLVFDGLFTYDAAGNFVPHLATEMYTVSEDGLVYTVTLREGVYFSNGNPMTADDVVFSYNLLADPSAQTRNVGTVMYMEGFAEFQAGEATELSGVVALDDHTIQFTFTEVRSNNYLSLGASIQNRADFPEDIWGNVAEVVGARNTTPVGSGTYMLQSWSAETGAVHVRNPLSWRTDWNENAPHTIIINPINDSLILQEWEAGTIDLWTNEIGGDNIDGLINSPRNTGFVNYTRGGMGYLAFNTAMGATEDVAVRQALMYAFDRPAANLALFPSQEFPEGIAFKPATFINPISSVSDIVDGTTPVEGLNDFAYNPERAIEILEEAGWVLGADGVRERNGERLVVRILSMPEHMILDTLVPIWTAEWSAIGVDLQVATLDFNTIVSIIQDDEALDQWNVFFLATSFTTDDIWGVQGFFESRFMPPNGSNFSRINDAELDRLFAEGQRELDPAAAREIAKQLAVRINELVPMMPIYSNLMFDFFDADHIQGYDAIQLNQWHQSVHTISVSNHNVN